MNLVIVESPAKAKTINAYLGSDFKVIASFGHIRDLPSKNGSVLPDEDFAIKYEISSKSKKHVDAICAAAKKSDVIYLATDPDREGESISWHIIETLKEHDALKKNMQIKRVVFHEITKKAVTSAIKSGRDIDINLVNAQQARRALDYLVGFTLSPVLWRKLPGSKSAGRVQSVALRIICDRENEIESFVKREYWDIAVDMKSVRDELFTTKLTHFHSDKLEKFTINNQEYAEQISASLKNNRYIIGAIEKKQQKRNPQPPFTTSSLQQEGARKLGFSAKKTMQIAQKLYEGVDIGGEVTGIITYMRTDGVSLSDDAVAVARQWIVSNLGDKYLPKSIKVYKTKIKNAQEAHEAVRPTDPSRTPESLRAILDNDQYKLYDLIWKRMIACQMESVVIDTVAANIESEDKSATLRAVGSMIAFDGFYKIYKEDVDDDNSEESKLLPILNQGEIASLISVKPNQHFTEPPPRYTEASLIKKLEELGIGRPSTWAPIISVLQERDYVKLDKKRFIPEERGILVTSFLVNFFNKYVEYDFTADLENELDEVANGGINWKEMLHKFWVDFHQNVNDVSKYKMSDIITCLEKVLDKHLFPKRDHDDANSKLCNSCGTGILGLKLSKYGAFIACSNYPECKFTKQISVTATSEHDANNTEDSISQDNNKLLGTNDGKDVHLKKGPYGWYVQMDADTASDKAKPKRIALPSGILAQNVTIELALNLLSLPKKLGVNPATKEEMVISIGRFGPYIKHAGSFTSIPKGDDIFNIDTQRAIEILSIPKKRRVVTKNE